MPNGIQVRGSNQFRVQVRRNGVPCGFDQFGMAHPERSRQFVDRRDRWIPAAPFKAADELLAEAGHRYELFLSQALHMRISGDYRWSSLARTSRRRKILKS